MAGRYGIAVVATGGHRSVATTYREGKPTWIPTYDGESGIVVVTVNPKPTDIVPLLAHPEKYKVIQTKAGDLDEVVKKAIEQAEREGAGAHAAQSS